MSELVGKVEAERSTERTKTTEQWCVSNTGWVYIGKRHSKYIYIADFKVGKDDSGQQKR